MVLVPDPATGVVGRASASNKAGSADLLKAGDATLVPISKGPSRVKTMSQREIEKQFGELLSALPPAPQYFTLFFRFESDELTPESRALVPDVLKAAKDRPAPEVVVTGHTDTTGTTSQQPGAGDEAGDHGPGAARRSRPRCHRDRNGFARRGGPAGQNARRDLRSAQSTGGNHDQMTVRPGRLVMLCGMLPTIAVALLSLYRPAFFRNWEFGAYDTVLRATPTRQPAGRIVIVDIDDRSLTIVGQWPWRRDVIGQLLTRLRDLGATTIALDIMFAEPERLPGAGASPDEALAETLTAGGIVLGYAMTFDGTRGVAGDCSLRPLGLAVVRQDDADEDPYFTPTGSICNLPVLTRAAASSGFLNAAPDPDGLLRRVPMLMELEGRLYPSLALTAVNTEAKTRGGTLRVANVNASLLTTGNRTVPLDGKSNLLVRYRGPEANVPIRVGG